MFKRILRLLLGMLGINLDGLLGEDNNPLAAYTVTLDPQVSAIGVSYKTNPEFKYNSETGRYEVEVLNGECITIVVTKTTENQPAKVTWQYTDANGELVTVNNYAVNWESFYDFSTQKTTWSAVWYVDSICANTDITITAN